MQETKNLKKQGVFTMTKFDLFLDLLFSINQLLEGGLTKDNIRDVRLLVNHSFKRFAEREIADISELGTIDGIAIKTLDMPKLLHDYPKVLTEFQNTGEGVGLMIGMFTILDELLAMGITSCSAHVARLKLDFLFNTYEQDNKDEGEQFEGMEELLTEIDDYIKVEREKYPEIFSNNAVQEETTPTEL